MVETLEQLVDEGEPITVKVAEVDLQRHRMRLDATGCGWAPPAKRTCVPAIAHLP